MQETGILKRGFEIMRKDLPFCFKEKFSINSSFCKNCGFSDDCKQQKRNGRIVLEEKENDGYEAI